MGARKQHENTLTKCFFIRGVEADEDFFSVGFNVVVMVLMFVSCPRGFVQPATSFQFFKVQSPGQIVNNVVPEGGLLWPKKNAGRGKCGH